MAKRYLKLSGDERASDEILFTSPFNYDYPTRAYYFCKKLEPGYSPSCDQPATKPSPYIDELFRDPVHRPTIIQVKYVLSSAAN